MARNKQGSLNGAYYSPLIAPSSESNQRSGRGCCCCFLSVLCKILLGIVIFLSVLCKILLRIVILAILAMLILYPIYQPQEFKVHVTNASLTEFNLANTTTTHPNIFYNLNLNLTVRNPDEKFGFYFEEMEARLYYGDQRFAAKNYSDFMLDTNTETNLKLSLKGQSLLLLNATGLKEFNEDKAAGVYKIDLKFRPWIFYRLRSIMFASSEVNCGLKVPLKESNATFKTSKVECQIQIYDSSSDILSLLSWVYIVLFFVCKYFDSFFLKMKSRINQKLNLNAPDLKECSDDKAAGVYKIDLKFQPQIQYK